MVIVWSGGISIPAMGYGMTSTSRPLSISLAGLLGLLASAIRRRSTCRRGLTCVPAPALMLMPRITGLVL